MNRYQQINENFNLERKQVIAIYTNCFISFIIFFILIGIIVKLGPIANDAKILMKNIDKTVDNINVVFPEINDVLPQAKTITHIAMHYIPSINQAINILKQICVQDPECHL